MSKLNRRNFIQNTSTAIAGGYFVAAGSTKALSRSALETLNVACVGVGGKGGSDSSNAAKFGNVIAMCDVDRSTLEGKAKSPEFKSAEKYTDYRELLAKHGKNIDIMTVSTPDHTINPNHLRSSLAGKRCKRNRRLHSDGKPRYGSRFLPRSNRSTQVWCPRHSSRSPCMVQSARLGPRSWTSNDDGKVRKAS